MKCPSCGDTKQQDKVGEIDLKKRPRGEAVPIVYRCSACKYLYTVPPSEGKKQDESPATG